MTAPNFFAELKQRNVYKVAIAYAVMAWLLMQVASQIFPFFEIPNWAVRPREFQTSFLMTRSMI
jgi:hypothetical protein